jgi:hypothetical protein
MNTLEIGKKLVELCREGKNEEAVNTLVAKRKYTRKGETEGV